MLSYLATHFIRRHMLAVAFQIKWFSDSIPNCIGLEASATNRGRYIPSLTSIAPTNYSWKTQTSRSILKMLHFRGNAKIQRCVSICDKQVSPWHVMFVQGEQKGVLLQKKRLPQELKSVLGVVLGAMHLLHYFYTIIACPPVSQDTSRSVVGTCLFPIVTLKILFS